MNQIMFSAVFFLAPFVLGAQILELDPASLNRIASHLGPLDSSTLRSVHSKLDETVFSYKNIEQVCGYEAFKLLDPSAAGSMIQQAGPAVN